MYKILIVEDDNVISEEIGRYLTKWGYDVKAVADFREVMGDFGKFSPPACPDGYRPAFL